jgi:hypothetical protein
MPFLGTRNYLHGTTLFEKMREVSGARQGLCFKVSKRIMSDQVVFCFPAPGEAAPAYAASLFWDDDGKCRSMFAMTAPPSVEALRLPYDESLITLNTRAGAGNVVYEGISPFSFVATLIPIFKVLLKNEIKVEKAGQWMFARLELQRVPDTFNSIELRMKNVLGGGMLARGSVSADGQDLGAIDFAWVSVDPGHG